MDDRGDVEVLADSKPLGRVVALLLALVELLRGSEGIFFGTRSDLQVRPLGPDVDVRTVLPAIFLLREVQGKHPDQDPELVVLRGLIVVYLADSGSRNFQEVVRGEACRCLGSKIGDSFVGTVFVFRNGDRQSRTEGLIGDPMGVPLAKPVQKLFGHAVGRLVILEIQLDSWSIFVVAGVVGSPIIGR